MPRKLQYLECFLEFDPHKGVRLIDLVDNMMDFSYYLEVYRNEITTKGVRLVDPTNKILILFSIFLVISYAVET